MKVKDIGEFALIERIAQIVEQADERVILTIGDDTAVVKKTELDYALLTTDLMVEDVHFTFKSITPHQLGYKSIAVNISDIAAMGGLPRYAVVSLALPPETEVAYVEDLYRGMAEVSRANDVRIVGGDVTRSEKLIINVALMGEVEEEKLSRRSDAQACDIIMVTGELGASAAGLRLVLHPDIEPKVKNAAALKMAHFQPKPQIKAGRILSSLGVNAMEDISDGLASEVAHICEASGVGARIHLNKVPIAAGVDNVAALTGERAIDLALSGGEDYGLVFTLSPHLQGAVERAFAEAGLKVTVVGEVLEGSHGITVIDWAGAESPMKQSGYTHF
ncbi:MAG: thiamine-phosphate kinase [Candidatus Aquicultor primus]|uniref:Thiamine-monophosphate kinase n=1 Tax=Candidatus Aquicultor primus TaxID=1797195 RepID=A0A1F2UHE4_9ACTN|nr:MAG: thiamine-phosphate kinase [Candidatus Aquicultor primus]HCG99300.1 thiamine-phosphate kinase [Actinomycetota bacterium]